MGGSLEAHRPARLVHAVNSRRLVRRKEPALLMAAPDLHVCIITHAESPSPVNELIERKVNKYKP